MCDKKALPRPAPSAAPLPEIEVEYRLTHNSEQGAINVSQQCSGKECKVKILQDSSYEHKDFVLGEWVHNPIQTEWSIPWVLKMGNCEIDDSETLAKADVETGATLMLIIDHEMVLRVQEEVATRARKEAEEARRRSEEAEKEAERRRQIEAEEEEDRQAMEKIDEIEATLFAELTRAEQKAATTLGYNRWGSLGEVWDNDEDSLNGCDDLDWAELNNAQRAAAKILGYNQRMWDSS